MCEFGTQYSGAIWSAIQSVTTLVGFELTLDIDSATYVSPSITFLAALWVPIRNVLP